MTGRQCAAINCKRHVRDCPLPGTNVKQHLCYRHGWWYASTHQDEYLNFSNVKFPVWTAPDIAIWLTSCGI